MERCRLSSLMSPPYVGDNQISKSRESYLPRTCTKEDNPIIKMEI